MSLWDHKADAALGAVVRQFCRDEVVPVADEIDKADVYPVELVQRTAARGWNTLNLPERYGGGGGSMADLLAVFEELSVGSGALGISLITIFQSQKIIEMYGNQELK